MFQLSDCLDEARRILGTCNDATFFARATEAVQLVANGGEFEGWKGFLDICTTCRDHVTLPREVGTVLAVMIGGQPTLGKDELFAFHLNGPGNCTPCAFEWFDMGFRHSTYRELESPSKLVAYTTDPADDNSKLIVHGFATDGTPLRRIDEDGRQTSGILIPTRYGYALPDPDAPMPARITGVSKAVTKGSIRLSTIDDEGVHGQLLGVYEPDETDPLYRRIRLGRGCDWVRIHYRKTGASIRSNYDRVPLMSQTAFFSALVSIRKRREQDLGGAMNFEADARRLELEAQKTLEPMLYRPVQVHTGGGYFPCGDTCLG